MSYHHIAIATRDMKATHEFYSRAMSFELVRAREWLLAAVHAVQEMDHHWCKSLYATDPNGILV